MARIITKQDLFFSRTFYSKLVPWYTNVYIKWIKYTAVILLYNAWDKNIGRNSVILTNKHSVPYYA